MNILIILLINIFSIYIWACPNFTGDYKFRNNMPAGEIANKLIIKQTNCEQIEFRHISSDYKFDFTFIYKIDDIAYQGIYYQHIDPKFKINNKTEGPADYATNSFHKVKFDGSKISIQIFDGAQKNCPKYTFLLSECTKYELSYELNENGLVEYAQIGFGKSKKDYTSDYFYLEK